MKIKSTILVMMLVMVLLLAGCDMLGDDITIIPDTDDPRVGELKVSFVGTRSDGISAQVDSRPHYDFARENYDEPFRNEEEGELVGRFSPDSMIVQIEDIGVAHPNYSRPLLQMSLGEQWILPSFDLVHSDEVIDASYIIDDGLYDFEVVEMGFSIRDGVGESVREFSRISEVHIDLGEKYEDVEFEHALDKYGTTHVFQMVDLIPFSEEKGTVSSTSISFDHNVEEPFILNPDGERVRDLKPYFWETDTRHGRAGYVIYRPGLELDFSDGGKNLIFEWQLDDLIEVYDAGSDNPEDHIVTFRLDNPFPISLRIDELTTGEREIEDTNLQEVNHLDARYYDLEEKQVALRWTNPGVENFKNVKIVRKEGSAPEDADDGEVVYEDKFPIFRDFDVERFKNYYYRVIVVGHDGSTTEGEVVNIETIPPQIAEIRFRTFYQGENDVEQIELKAGEEEMVIVSGFDENGEYYNIAPDWSFTNPDIVEITRTQTDELGFKVLDEGETQLQASLDDDFGGLTAILDIVVEGKAEFDIDIEIVGQGNIDISPDKESYYYLDEISISAIPDEGWSFVGWDYDLSSTDKKVDLILESDMQILAKFEEKEEFDLEIDIEGKGSVEIEPEQENYYYGDIIELTAIPDEGWQFMGWEGDFSSNDKNIEIEIHDNIFIKAVFVDTVFFEDPNLEEIVLDIIDKPVGEITEEDFAQIEEIYADYRNISSLEGIEKLVNLETLYLTNNQIENIEPLADLSNLKSLALDNNDISDISPLADIEYLEAVFLGGNQITDIQDLSGMKNLRVFHVQENYVENIERLEDFASIENLNLQGNEISEIDVLLELPELKTVNLEDNSQLDTTVDSDSFSVIQELISRGVEVHYDADGAYTLGVESFGQGNIEVDPVKDLYLEGETVIIEINPDSGWVVLDNWPENRLDDERKWEFEMEDDLALNVYFVEENTSGLLWNEDIIAQSGLSNLADLSMKDGWSWDDFKATVQVLVSDSTGDGQIDTFGFGLKTPYEDRFSDEAVNLFDSLYDNGFIYSEIGEQAFDEFKEGNISIFDITPDMIENDNGIWSIDSQQNFGYAIYPDNN